APDQQPDGNDRDNQNKSLLQDVAELLAELFRAADAEAVRLVGRNAAAQAQQPANLVFSNRLHPRVGHGGDEVLIVIGIVFAISAIRNDYVVITATEVVFLFLENADHGVGTSVNQHLLSHRALVLKE